MPEDEGYYTQEEIDAIWADALVNAEATIARMRRRELAGQPAKVIPPMLREEIKDVGIIPFWRRWFCK